MRFIIPGDPGGMPHYLENTGPVCFPRTDPEKTIDLLALNIVQLIEFPVSFFMTIDHRTGGGI